jgi:hydroxymethylglutaryl-CoA lyase
MSDTAITIREVGPRDGLQNEPLIDTPSKVELIRRLAQTGLSEIEVTSFVSPKWVPQFADAAEVVPQLAKLQLYMGALVPNQKGYDAFRQLSPPLSEACFFIGATDAFNEHNVNRSTSEHLKAFAPVLLQMQADQLHTLAYISCVCGCPYDGVVPISRVVDLAGQLLELGFDRISLGDTIGVGTPDQVSELIDALAGTDSLDRFAFHGHDTYGRALANAWAAYEQGVRIFDSSVAGLGGCPFAPGAQGNVATEDLVDLFEKKGISTGVDQDALHAVVTWMDNELFPDKQIGGKVYLARQRKL